MCEVSSQALGINTSMKIRTKFPPLRAHSSVGKMDIRQRENHMNGYIIINYVYFFFP